MDKNEPLVSIVSTLYNYKDYVVEMIESVRKQFYQNWELIIIDDGSIDEPLGKLKSFLKDDRIRYVRFNENHGYSFAKNEGIVRTHGDYIVMIDADDMLTDISIQCRVNELSKYPDKLWCYGNTFDLEVDGSVTSRGTDKRNKLRKRLSKEMDLTKTYHHRLIHSQSVMVRREFHKILGLYDESLRFSSDNEMFRRAIRFGYVPLYVPQFVSYYRRHHNQMSRSPEKKKLIVQVKKVIIKIVEQRFQNGICAKNTRIWSTING